MYSEAKKPNIIEEVLEIKSDVILSALELFLKKVKEDESPISPSGFSEFSAIWPVDEVEEIERIIAESC